MYQRSFTEYDCIIDEAVNDEKALLELINGISPEKRKKKERELASKALQRMSMLYPSVLYCKWDIFAELLKSDNVYSKFPAIYVLANLACIDAEGKLEEVFDDYFGLLGDESIAVSSHVALNAAKIAKAKPDLETRITDKMLNVDLTGRSSEHMAIVSNYIIQAFDEYFEHSSKKAEIIAFAVEQLESVSSKTRKTAKRFLKSRKLGINGKYKASPIQ